MNQLKDEFWRKYLIKASISLPELYRGVVTIPLPDRTWQRTNRANIGTVSTQHKSWVEMTFSEKTREESEIKYNEFFTRKESIEKIFGEELDWRPGGNSGKASRCKIMSAKISLGYLDTSASNDLIEQLLTKMKKFIAAIDSSEQKSGLEGNKEKYLPTKKDVEVAASQVPIGVRGNLDAILDKVERNVLAAGKILQDNWRMITERNIAIWFK